MFITSYYRVFFVLLSILLPNHLMDTISVCDNSFRMDSYALTYFTPNEPNSSDINVFEFFSNSYYYWLQSFLEKRIPLSLPDGMSKVDGAFFLDTLNCSQKDIQLIAIENNTFGSFSFLTKQWKTNQSLKTNSFLSKILDPISDEMQIEAITDWKPNRIIVFRNKSYKVIEWKSICDAINGIGLKIYSNHKTNEWFDNSTIDSAQLFVPNEDNSNQSLYIFSQNYFREMKVKELNQSNGQIIGQFEDKKSLKEAFVCVPETQPQQPTVPDADAGKGGTDSPVETSDKSTSPLLAIICAIFLLSLILIGLVYILPKDKYILSDENID